MAANDLVTDAIGKRVSAVSGRSAATSRCPKTPW